MSDFLLLTTSLPAAPFALAVALSLAYWVVALVGGLDLGLEAADGAAAGAGEALEGALDGAADGLVDGALDAAADAADAVVDGAAEAGQAVGGAAALASVLRLGRVPLTVWLSLFSLWGWVLSFVAGWALLHPLQGSVPAWLGAGGGLVGAALGGALLAGFTSRPLEAFFRSHHGRDRGSLVGEVAEITTSRVDARFGQARLSLGGDDLVVQVRNDRPENGLGRGGRALVVGFDREREAYVVEPIDPGTGRARRAATPHAQTEG